MCVVKGAIWCPLSVSEGLQAWSAVRSTMGDVGCVLLPAEAVCGAVCCSVTGLDPPDHDKSPARLNPHPPPLHPPEHENLLLKEGALTARGGALTARRGELEQEDLKATIWPPTRPAPAAAPVARPASPLRSSGG